MKIKTALMTGILLVSASVTSHAAQFILNNVVAGGPGDVLWGTMAPTSTPGYNATTNNSLLSSTGVVAFGYFNSALILGANLDTNAEVFGNLSNFISVTTAVPGDSANGDLGAAFPGYIQQAVFTQANGGVLIPAGSSLVGRDIYLIFSDAASLLGATASSTFAVLKTGQFLDDSGGELQYFGNPSGVTPTLGTLGKFTGNASGQATGAGTYDVVRLAVVPEPSSALLGALCAFGLLRRRRN